MNRAAVLLGLSLERRRKQIISRLAGTIIDAPPVRTRRWAVVTATHTVPNRVDLLMNGTAVPGVRYLASYSPTVDDTVIVMVEDKDPIVYGKLA